MDFTPELSAFQGVMISADSIYTFSRISCKSGNEDKVKDIIAKIKKYLLDLEVRNGSLEMLATMRKFSLYVVFNADLSVLNEMVEFQGIDLVIWTMPTIPKYLMCELLWSLHMDMFVQEIISYCNPLLSSQVADACVDNVKYCTPAASLTKIKLLSTACYVSICRLIHLSVDDYDIPLLLMNIFNTFQKCVNYFTVPPNGDKLLNISKDDKYKFIGNSLISMLTLITECINNFTNIPKKLDKSNSIYMSTFKEGTLDNSGFDRKVCEAPNKSILECLNKCNSALLDTCQELVMAVSVDVFCAWSEFEEDNKSMQETIGEYCFNLLSQLQQVSTIAEHPLVAMLAQIARKPADFNELINCLETKVIIENMSNNVEKSKWVHAIINKVELCGDIELVEVLVSNKDLLNDDSLKKITDIFLNYLDTDSTINKDYIQFALFKIFQNLSIESKLEVLAIRFAEGLCDLPESPEVRCATTEAFNKLVATPGDSSGVLAAFLLGPRRFYARVLALAAAGPQQARVVARLVALIAAFADHRYPGDAAPCLDRAAGAALDAGQEPEVNEDNLVQFLAELKTTGVLGGARLMMRVAAPALCRALRAGCPGRLRAALRLAGRALPAGAELEACRAPLLVLAARAMAAARRAPRDYCARRAAALRAALHLQARLMHSYGAAVPARERAWLLRALGGLEPLAQVHYRRLWLGDAGGAGGAGGGDFLAALSGQPDVAQAPLAALVPWLAQVLSRCERAEWAAAYSALAAARGPGGALHVLHAALTRLHAAGPWGCTLHALRCLLHVARNTSPSFLAQYSYLGDDMDESRARTVLALVAQTARWTAAGEGAGAGEGDVGGALLPVLAHLLQHRARCAPFDVAEGWQRAVAGSPLEATFLNLPAADTDTSSADTALDTPISPRPTSPPLYLI